MCNHLALGVEKASVHAMTDVSHTGPMCFLCCCYVLPALFHPVNMAQIFLNPFYAIVKEGDYTPISCGSCCGSCLVVSVGRLRLPTWAQCKATASQLIYIVTTHTADVWKHMALWGLPKPWFILQQCHHEHVPMCHLSHVTSSIHVSTVYWNPQ